MAFWKNKKEKERQMPDQAPEDAVKTGNDETTTKDESVAQTKRKKIDEQAVREAAQTLKQYQAGKKNLENRIKEEEEFFRLRIWDHIRSTMTKEERERDTRPQPTSAWLFNSVINKHADMMDNYPTFACLPREQSDEESAKILSSVLPVILERRNFEETYSRNSYSKVKFGTGVYGVSWNRDLEDGEYGLFASEAGSRAIRLTDDSVVFVGEDRGPASQAAHGKDPYPFRCNLGEEAGRHLLVQLRRKHGLDKDLGELLLEEFGGENSTERFQTFCKENGMVIRFVAG